MSLRVSHFVEDGEADDDDNEFNLIESQFSKNFVNQHVNNKQENNKSLQYSIIDRVINLEEQAPAIYNTAHLG